MKQNNLQYDNNIQSFKRQTLQLLKQQTDKIRQSNALISTKQQELIIKQQQINFLKQTIKQLQNDNLNLIQENNQLKSKLDRIVSQITNYNQNIIKPICEQKQYLKINNQQLKNQNDQFKKKLTILQNQLNNQKYKSSQANLQVTKLQSFLKQQKLKLLDFQQKLHKQALKTSKLNQEIIRVNQSLKEQQLKRERQQIQCSTLTKQLSSLVSKCNSLTKQYQQKISQIKAKSIDKNELVIYQQLVKKKQQQITTLNRQFLSLNISNEQNRKKYLQIKQKSAKQLAKMSIKYNQLSTDILNFKKSIQIEKKVVEFQSQCSETFYRIYQHFTDKNQELNQLKQRLQELLKENQQYKRKVQELSHSLHDTEIQQTLLKTQLQQQLQRLQSTYQGKLVSLNLKIKTEEQALQKLRKRQIQAMQQNQRIYEQLQKTRVDFILYKQTSQKSLSRLNNQNYQIVSQMQQLYKICQQNVDSKRILDKIKYVANSLVVAIYYLQLLAVRAREKQRKIYMPFVTFYMQVSNKINSLALKESYQIQQKQQIFKFKSNKSNSISKLTKINHIRKINKLKVCVWTVIASIRIRNKISNRECKKIQNIQGLPYKICKGLSRRNKIHNIKQIIQKQSQIISKKEDIEQIINQIIIDCKNMYSWQQLNYKKMIIQTPRYLSSIQRIHLYQGKQQKPNNIINSEKNGRESDNL